MDQKRRLSAVWFADIVGYTTLSQTDEPAALTLVELLQAHAREIVAEHDGRVVKLMGDAVLAEFSSTDSAVRAAVALQERYVADAQGIGTPSMLRVGVHLGEVTPAADGDLYGDGINTAARLQHEAVPGQVIISEDVWRQLRQRPEFRFASLGAVELRGITSKLEIYNVLFGSRAALDARSAAAAGIVQPAARRGSAVLIASALLSVAILAAVAYVMFGRQPAIAEQPAQAAAPSAPASQTPAASVPRDQPVAAERSTTRPAPAQTRTAAPRSSVAGTPVTERGLPQMRDRDGVRVLLEQFVAALNGATPRESVAAFGPGAALMSRRGVHEILTLFGEGLETRLGRIEPLATRGEELDVRFIVLAESTAKAQTPLAFLATVSRATGAYRFTQLRRDAPGRRGPG